MRTVVQLMDSLGFNRGGLTKAVYKRVNMYCEKGYTVIVCVTRYQPDAKEIFLALQKQGLLHTDARFHSLVNSDIPMDVDRSLSGWTRSANRVEAENRNDRVVRHFDNLGRFLGLEKLDSSGHKLFEDHHSPLSPHVITHRAFFDRAQNIRKVQYFDTSWNPRFETVFGEAGAPVYSAWISPEGKQDRFIYFGDESEDTSEFPTWNDLRSAMLGRWLNTFTQQVSVISDEPMTMPLLIQGESLDHVTGIGVMHTTHFIGSGYENPLRYKGWLSRYVPGKGMLKKVVCITNAQLADLRTLMPDLNEENSAAIPHALSNPNSFQPKPDFKMFAYRLLYLGRLAPEKQVGSLIEGFAKALEDLPKLRLDLVGEGPESAHLRELVSRLGIEDAVTFHGYQNEPLNWYDNCDALLMNSKFEGFGLTILEAFSCSCPVISSPTKYGPLELVRDGINGLMFDGSPSSLYEQIKNLYADEQRYKEMRENALLTLNDYPQDQYSQAWTRILD
ncbi:hypothetical protein HMPREF2690_00205 [Corynebacterium sp. HMSC034E11]|uniref:glycosyltransferase n=1 Tax=Corynebacterium sp. HMSC034E11 TaxID=1715169 RepID=UPI0008A97915|nr:glycosyltransferase [Corynebacterium sp. HMSC034E11]OHO33900.1 hypothetical protein HMPREF2690_00205 [Corynebacterium sp. HMSC034E11]